MSLVVLNFYYVNYVINFRFGLYLMTERNFPFSPTYQIKMLPYVTLLVVIVD